MKVHGRWYVRAGIPGGLFKPINCMLTCGGTVSTWLGTQEHISTMESIRGTMDSRVPQFITLSPLTAATRCAELVVSFGLIGAKRRVATTCLLIGLIRTALKASIMVTD